MKNLNIGTRLGLGFAIVLLLLTALTGIGVWRMQQAGVMTEHLMTVGVGNERLIEEWDKVIRVNAARTTTAWIATDPAFQSEVEAQMKRSSARATEIQEQLGKVLQDPKPRALLARVLETRAAYTTARAAVFKEKAAGNLERAKEIYQNDMNGKREIYLAALDELNRAQRASLDATAAEIDAQYRSGRVMLIALGTLAMAIGIACAIWITGTITRPLRAAVQVAESVAAGDLTSTIVVDSDDETGKLMTSLKSMNDNLVHIVGDVRRGTDAISTASREIANGNMDLSSRTEDQASSLQETASAMEELTSTVQLNADNAREANQLVIDAAAVAGRGGEAVADVVNTMHSINASSSKIVDIISVIDGIAFQTNILALNAAVEAARAGEQGRGFAVVASEVRTLAQRSAAAAKEIKELISASVSQVHAGTELVDRAGQTMGEVVGSITRVARIMSDISTASDEQRDGIEQINLAVTQMDQVTQQNAALVEEAAAAAASMQDESERLSQAVEVFKLDARSGRRVAPALLEPR